MAHQVASIPPSTLGKKQPIVEEVKEEIPISPPDAVHIEETIFHLTSADETADSYCLDDVDLERNPDFLAWLEKQPQDIQKEIMEGLNRINNLSLEELPQDESPSVAIPVNHGTYVFQNAFHKGRTVPCSRLGCQNQFQVDEVTSLFCPECSP